MIPCFGGGDDCRAALLNGDQTADAVHTDHIRTSRDGIGHTARGLAARGAYVKTAGTKLSGNAVAARKGKACLVRPTDAVSIQRSCVPALIIV